MSNYNFRKESQKKRIEALRRSLEVDDIQITISGIESCLHRILRIEKQKHWRSLSETDRNHALKLAEEKLRASAASGKHRRKNWQIDGKSFTSRALYDYLQQLMLENGEERKLPTEQNFGVRLQQLQKMTSSVVTSNGVIDNASDLLEMVAYWPKNAPATVYRLRFVAGPFRGKSYIGITQCTVAERLNWHFINAKRCAATSNKLYQAIAASLAISGDHEKWLQIDTLDKDIPPKKAIEREAHYCEEAFLDAEEDLLNSAKPGSIGGRNGYREVSYKNETYYLEDGIRAVAKDLEIPSEKFLGFSA